MNAEFGNTMNMSNDMYEIGLIAAASPDFAEKLLRAMLAAGETGNAGEGSSVAATAPAAAA
jgi:hypothetical protein